jgi:hypothetical protein
MYGNITWEAVAVRFTENRLCYGHYIANVHNGGIVHVIRNTSTANRLGDLTVVAGHLGHSIICIGVDQCYPVGVNGLINFSARIIIRRADALCTSQRGGVLATNKKKSSLIIRRKSSGP